MNLTKEIQESIPFQYANDVRSGKITTGKYIKLAVERFFQWIEDAEKDGYHLDHDAGMDVIDFFEYSSFFDFLNINIHFTLIYLKSA